MPVAPRFFAQERGALAVQPLKNTSNHFLPWLLHSYCQSHTGGKVVSSYTPSCRTLVLLKRPSKDWATASDNSLTVYGLLTMP